MGGSIDLERRFGGTRRLYGALALESAQAARIAVVGVGGVGSWAAEALARSGVGQITLIDLDHIAESNINRQVHALGATLGQAKILAMAERLQHIHPSIELTLHDAFLDAENAEQFLAGHACILDCTDQMSAKLAMVLQARSLGLPLMVCGAAGGKTDGLALRRTDLRDALHDPLLSRLRQTLRRHHGYPAGQSKRPQRMQVECLWVDQPVRKAGIQGVPQGLSCAGYGSLVTVTAAMGLAAAAWALDCVLTPPRHD